MYSKYIKRILDVFFSIIFLPFFLILLVFIFPAVKLDDKGPVFYCSRRIGRNGRIFKMYKFRTMVVNAPDIRREDGSTWNSDDDPRLTRIGRILRKLSIDEIPQIINIIKGDMSFIGPRPDLPDQLDNYTEDEKDKLKVRPGISGYNQAFFRNSVPAKQRFINDVFYVNNLTFKLDLKIVLATFKAVLSHENVYVKSDNVSHEIN